MATELFCSHPAGGMGMRDAHAPPTPKPARLQKLWGGGMATERVRAAEGMGISTDRDFKRNPPAVVFPLYFPKER